MHKGKLVEILQSLRPLEMNRLRKFVQSPFHNSNEQIEQLFDFLHRFYPKFTSRKLEAEYVFSRLFPEEKYTHKTHPKLLKLASGLFLLVKDFLVINEALGNPGQKERLWIQVLGKRNKHAWFEREISRAADKIKKKAIKGQEAYSELLWLNHLHYFHPYTERFSIKVQSLQDAMGHLDRFYFLSKLKYGGELKAREVILREKHNLYMIKEALLFASDINNNDENPLFSLYANFVRLHSGEEGLDTFLDLKQRLMEEETNLSTADKQNTLMYLVNFAIRKYNNGEIDFQEEQLNLYKIGLEKGLLLAGDGKMTEKTFTNIALLGATLKDFDWTDKFILKYEESLRREKRQYAVNFARAYYFFHRGAYEKVRELLPLIDVSDTSFDFRIKGLRLRTYYELWTQEESGIQPALESMLESYSLFMRRHRKIDRRKADAYLNFIRLTKKLYLFSVNLKDWQPEIYKLEKEIENTQPLTLKNWLLEKVEALKKPPRPED